MPRLTQSAAPTPEDADIQVMSFKQRAYLELKRRILSGELPPGVLLSERTIASELNMSKTPVHAALERLEADGLVRVAPQQGIVVCEVSSQDIIDHFEMRQALEMFVVGKLAGRLTSEQCRLLKENLRSQAAAVKGDDFARNIECDSAFHVMLCEFHGNREITRTMNTIREKANFVIRQILIRNPHRVTASYAEHQSIVKALIAGDGAGAMSRMDEHLTNGLRSVYSRS